MKLALIVFLFFYPILLAASVKPANIVCDSQSSKHQMTIFFEPNDSLLVVKYYTDRTQSEAIVYASSGSMILDKQKRYYYFKGLLSQNSDYRIPVGPGKSYGRTIDFRSMSYLKTVFDDYLTYGFRGKKFRCRNS